MTRCCLALFLWLAILPPACFAESINEGFTDIAPGQNPGSGEFVHGRGYGKVLMRVLMFGAVPRQGIHYMPEGTDLLFAMLYGGGYGDETQLNGITIRRRNIQELIEVDLEDLVESGEPVPRLYDGDVVNVPYNWKKSYQEFSFVAQLFVSLTSLVLSIVALTN